MKKEKGSALLTVVLIVFVTATIGAAISSFIMMNYKLRTLDNWVTRAEYEAEKKIDNIYQQVQMTLGITVEASVTNAISEINGEVNTEYAALSGGQQGDYEYVYNVGETIYRNEAKIVEAQKEKYLEELAVNFVNGVKGEFANVDANSPIKGITLIESNKDFGKSGTSVEVKLNGNNFKNDNTIKVELYYQEKNVPAVLFKVDFVISFPSFENAESNNYNLNDLINLINWEMETMDM